MKKTLFLSIFLAALCLAVSASAGYNKNDISKIAIDEKDIPDGFVIGKLPNGAKKVLKENPSYFDSEAIKKLTERIYPDGDYKKVSALHMTILAEEKRPYRDNIVCCIIVYKDGISAKEEITKLKNYAGFNSDRSLLIQKDNLAVFIYSNDVNDFHYVQDMAEGIRAKIKDM
jgi:hypothetical protein